MLLVNGLCYVQFEERPVSAFGRSPGLGWRVLRVVVVPSIPSLDKTYAPREESPGTQMQFVLLFGLVVNAKRLHPWAHIPQ